MVIIGDEKRTVIGLETTSLIGMYWVKEMGRNKLLLKACCGHRVWGLDIWVSESADKFEDFGAYGMREEYDLAATTRVVDCKHINLFDVVS